MIARRPETGGGGQQHRPPSPGAGDDSFDFRWIPEHQPAASGAPATALGFGSSSSSSPAPRMARREDAQNRIVIALTIACTAMALIDLFLLASGL